MEKVEILQLPKILDERGNLSFLESNSHVPFEIKRTFWIYDVPGGEIRGGHAFKEQKEFIIVLSGSLDVIVFDGEKEQKFSLNRSYYGLYVPSGVWRHMENFATNTLALVISSTSYDENDYIRDKDEYLKMKGNES
ncbi:MULTISPECIES: sugar 3,4-ketoisomerase [unclassified Tenacibaculum]|uniref:sugar 3,4-ketoisomerase n=1 Tax=unclassified Tenacibaculum TaxID=2635139 RepID=UPI001F3CD585|nr:MULTISPECIES: FdtA/QdtA family cupin domain-containing protein [unclassified Tenacibaculum]MCF2876619.1 FdtA/QdtA family cupin domain-containing protein [Tenacibaculum sp. Cn5-1]MCF2936770.1 FdtA/QdtA family cupin domain-containing protein [Tenacibaculum sp. Cn5-34]MCG7512994.1 FdtA/QdtA family cupin domain-containing protein [Tenacibaculum sp. Cn5-46]